MDKETQNWDPELYARRHNFVHRYGESLVELLQPAPQERILDLGCGTGELTSKLADFGATVTGMDLSGTMIAAARARFPELDFIRGDASDFDFPLPFDAVFSNAALHWVHRKDDCIRAIYRNLRPGGRFVAEFGGKGNVSSITGALRRALKSKGYEENALRNPWYFPSLGEYTSALEAAGFRVGLAEHYERPTPLAEAGSGMADWLRMFGGAFLEDIPDPDREAILDEVQEGLRPACFRNGKWYADYWRLRVQAWRE